MSFRPLKETGKGSEQECGKTLEFLLPMLLERYQFDRLPGEFSFPLSPMIVLEPPLFPQIIAFQVSKGFLGL